MDYKLILSTVAILLTFYAFYPYIRSIKDGETKPHYFSWIIWGLTTTLSSFTQLADHGGVGAYSVSVAGVICFYIAYLAYQQEREYHIEMSDWVVFYVALGSLVVWYITSTPLWTAIILTTIDAIGFIPTFKKAYSYPWEEHIGFYVIISLKDILAIGAMENYSVTTTIFLLSLFILGVLFILFLLWRRRVLGYSKEINTQIL
jgi:hypothetical protein